MNKHRANRLGWAILLAFFRDRGRFPRDESEVERLRVEIRARFGFREATISDAEMLTEWLRDHVAGEADGEIESMIERLETRCCELAIEPPTADRMERIARTALRTHEERFHYGRLSPAIRERLDKLLRPAEGDSESESGTALRFEHGQRSHLHELVLQPTPMLPLQGTGRAELPPPRIDFDYNPP